MIVTTRGARDAVDRFGVRRFSRRTKTPGRTAKSCGPDAATLASSRQEIFPPATVARKAAHRGEHEVSRKAIAQGMSDCLRCPVCSCAPFLRSLAHETAGAARTRHSLRPRFSRGAMRWQSSGEIAPRERSHLSFRGVRSTSYDAQLRI
jgi:hypothetical protein